MGMSYWQCSLTQKEKNRLGNGTNVTANGPHSADIHHRKKCTLSRSDSCSSEKNYAPGAVFFEIVAPVSVDCIYDMLQTEIDHRV